MKRVLLFPCFCTKWVLELVSEGRRKREGEKGGGGCRRKRERIVLVSLLYDQECVCGSWGGHGGDCREGGEVWWGFCLLISPLFSIRNFFVMFFFSTSWNLSQSVFETSHELRISTFEGKSPACLHYGRKQPRIQTEVLDHSLVHSLICSLAHSFACSRLLALLTPSTAFTGSLTLSLCSLPSSWESEWLDDYFVCVFFYFRP